MTQKHIIKIVVDIKSVKLLVRFPCKLTFQIKTQSSQADSRNSYELKKGECLVNQTLQTQSQILFDTINGQYEDKKVKLIIQMASTNGIIPAGSVSFNPCNKQYHQKVQYTLSLQKCPDRSAQITFFQSYQLLRKNHAQNMYQSQMADKSSKVLKNQMKYSGALNLAQGKSPRDLSNNSKVRLPMNPNINSTSNIREISPKNNPKMKTQQVYGNYRNSTAYEQNQPQQHNFTQFNESQVVHEEQINYAYSRNPINKLQPQEKNNYLKQISKLKGQIKIMQSQQRWDQVARIKQQNQILGNELQKGKEKIRNLQRRQRQINLQLKQAREEGQRIKSKYIQSQSLKNEYQSNVNDKQKLCKQYQNEIKRLQQKIQDLNTQLSNQQKRVQFKESSYQQQLKKLSQKYTQSENERQKITFDYNGLLAKLQQAQKKHQTAAKQKQRFYSQQKNKLNKKIDQLTQSLQKLKEDHSEKEAQLNQLTNNLKNLQKRQTQRQQKLSNLQSQYEMTKNLLRKQVDQRKIYQKDIEQYKVIEEDRNSLRKKNNQLSGELSKIGEKCQRLTADLNSSQSKIKQFQVLIADKNKQRDIMNTRYNSLKKDYQNLKRQEQKQSREQETLSVQHFNAGQKINQLKSKLDTQKRDNEERSAYYQEQIAYLSKGRQYCQHEIEQLKWSLSKSHEQNQDLSARLKQSNQQIMSLNQQILISQERAKRAEDQKKQLNFATQNFKKQIHEMQQKIRLLNENIKNKDELNYENIKKIQNYEGENFIFKEKLKQTETAFEQRRLSDQKNLKERQRSISHKSQQITQLQLEIMGMKQQISSLTQEVAMKNNQLHYLKDNLQNIKQDLNIKQQNVTQNNKDLSSKGQILQNQKRQIDVLNKNLDEQKKNGVKLKKQWEDYRKQTTKALQKLIQEIFKDEQSGSYSVKYNLNTFPDATISAMQVQALKKRNSVLSKYHSKISQLQDEKMIQETHIKKLNKDIKQKQEQYESLLQIQKQKYKQFSQEHASQIEQLQKNKQIAEDKILNLSSQLQKSNNEIHKKQQLLEQLRDNYNSLGQEKQILRNELKQYEQKILILKSQEIKWKAQNQIKISQLSGNNQSIIQRLKGNLIDLEKKMMAEERVIKEKEENIKRLEGKITELTYDKQKSQNKNEELQEKTNLILEEKKELQKRIKNQEKQIKELTIQLNNFKDSYNNEKIKLQEIQSKYMQNYTILTQSQVELQKLKAQIQINNDQKAQLQITLKDKTQKGKVSSQKYLNEIKILKQKIINLDSSIQLKDFQIKQQQNQLISFKQTINETKQDNNKKKLQIIKLSDKVQQYKNQEMYTSQNIQILQSQKQFLQEQNDRLKERLNTMEEQLSIVQFQLQAAHMKEQDYSKLKQDYQVVKTQKQKLMIEMRNIAPGSRSSAIFNTSRLATFSGDEKKKIRQLQQLLQSKHIDLSIERKKLLNQFDRQRRQILTQNNQLREEVSNLQNQFDFQRVQLQKEIQSLGQQIKMLQAELQEKSNMILIQQDLLQAVKLQGDNEQLKDYMQRIKKLIVSLQNGKQNDNLQYEAEREDVEIQS